MRKLLFLFLFSPLMVQASSDDVTFEYDECGNVTARKVVVSNAETRTMSDLFSEDNESDIMMLDTISSINVFPNPTSDYVYVKGANIDGSTEITYLLYNGYGQLVSSQTSNDITVRFDLSNYNSGVYLIKVDNHKEIPAFKIIKK